MSALIKKWKCLGHIIPNYQTIRNWFSDIVVLDFLFLLLRHLSVVSVTILPLVLFDGLHFTSQSQSTVKATVQKLGKEKCTQTGPACAPDRDGKGANIAVKKSCINITVLRAEFAKA